MSIYPLMGAPALETQENDSYFVIGDTVVRPGSFPSIVPVEFEWSSEELGGTIDPAASYYPQEITLHGPRRLLARPIDVERSVVGETQYVADRVVSCWGSGESLDDAIEDYEHNLLEAYEDLIAAGENLSRLAQERLDLLRSFLDLPR
jgi:hypothetical protein